VLSELHGAALKVGPHATGIVAQIVFTLEEDNEVEFDPAQASDAKTLGDLVALGNEAVSTQVG